MKKHNRKFAVAALLALALVYPLSMIEARRVSTIERTAQPERVSPPANSAAEVHKIKKATLPAVMIKAIRKTEGIKRAVIIKGNTISPRRGTSLWTDGLAYVLISDSKTPTPMSQAIIKNLPGGAIHFKLCICATSGGDDPCKFDGGEDASHCGGKWCCGFHEGDVAADGGVTLN